MLKRSLGFTIIELVLVIAIIGILVSISVPGYQVYERRAQVSEAMLLTVNVRLAVANYYAYHGKLPVNNRQAGLVEPRYLRGQYVAAVVVRNGSIHAKLNNVLGGGTIDFTPSTTSGYVNHLYWTCGSANVPVSYLASNCKP